MRWGPENHFPCTYGFLTPLNLLGNAVENKSKIFNGGGVGNGIGLPPFYPIVIPNLYILN